VGGALAAGGRQPGPLPNGHMSSRPPGSTRASSSLSRPRGLLSWDHAFPAPALDCLMKSGGSRARHGGRIHAFPLPGPPEALLETGGIWPPWWWLVPGDPFGTPGTWIPGTETRHLAPAIRTVATRRMRTGWREMGTGAGRVVRGLSHPQDGPLTTAGAAELQPGPGPCGLLGTRTADRMAVPWSPSIRERACPAA